MGKAPYPVHVKVDTGLNRFGVAEERAVAFVRSPERESGDRTSTASRRISRRPMSSPIRFCSSRARGSMRPCSPRLRRMGLRPRVVACGELRRGVAGHRLLGHGTASASRSTAFRPRRISRCRRTSVPALSVQSRVARVLDLPRATTVGYGRTFMRPSADARGTACRSAMRMDCRGRCRTGAAPDRRSALPADWHGLDGSMRRVAFRTALDAACGRSRRDCAARKATRQQTIGDLAHGVRGRSPTRWRCVSGRGCGANTTLAG